MQDSAPPQVLFEELPAKQGKLGVITLNRPESLNALSIQMIISITNKLNQWKLDPELSAVVIKSSSDKAFCAGGDIKRLYTLGPAFYQQETEYFGIEYRLSNLIYTYPKPYLALLDGIAMGGGLGLSLHGTRIVASEKLRLAVPETAIGLYPDAGATHFLGHCPDYLGMYLGLTGSTIGVDDAIFCELVDHFVPSAQINNIVTDLTQQDLSTDPLKTIDQVIANYSKNPNSSPLARQLKIIKACFSLTSVEAIVEALEQDGSDWATQQLAIIKTRSPSSLKITHRAVTLAKEQAIYPCLEREFNLTIQVLQSHDLYEGIRSVLIDKTHDPKWQPSTLEEISDAMLDAIFEIKCKL